MGSDIQINTATLACHACESSRKHALIVHVFDMLTIGIACIRKSGELMYFNRPALSMLERYGLLANAVSHDHDARRIRNQAVRKLCLDVGQTVVVTSADGELQIQVEPFHSACMHWNGEEERRRGAVLVLREPLNIGLPSVEQLKSLYGFTHAEARLALALCSGKTVAACAESFGVTLATVRTQLRAMMGKTGSRRQAELLTRLLSAPSASIQTT